MKALVLAAGRGERLRPLTEKTPKVMLEVGGRPLIHYPLMLLRRAGITRVAINVHHLAAKIEKALARGDGLGIEITYAPEPVLFGTGGPILALRGYLGDESFVVANADTILDLDLAAMIRFHRSRGAVVTIALHRPPNLDDYSRLEIDAEAKLRRIRLLNPKAPGGFDDYPRDLDPGVTLSAYMYCGVCVLEPAVFAMMPSTPPFSLMGDVIAPMVAKGMPILGYVHRGFFRTVDDLKSYQALRAEFAANPPRLDFI
ncbi:MAG: NDP-sugar synthase [Candidatus Binataceae bacterium]